MTRILIPGALVLLVVMSLVGLSGWNRSAAPRQVIELTERELQAPYVSPADRAGRAISLQLQYEGRSEPLDARNWLSEDKLRVLGFDLATPATAPEAANRYRRAAPRIAWVAFEYDGPASRDIARRREVQKPNQGMVWRGRVEPSRLVPVDATPEFESLRARYPSGHLLARAIIVLNYLGPGDRGPLLYATVREIVPSRITVPRHLRDAVLNLPPFPTTGPDGPPTDVAPRFVAEIASGPLGVLYLRSVRPR
jgi:hypothetical protein